MKCDIIKDLLPLYVEGLTSKVSNEEIEKHLASCKGCETFYREMSGDIEVDLPVSEPQELDYLKKVRRKSIREVLIGVGIVFVIFIAIISMFAVGFSVSSEDVNMAYQLEDNILEINLELKNGQDLIWSGKDNIIYDESHNIIGTETRYILMKTFNNPFNDKGSSCTLETEIPNQSSQEKYTNKVIIQYEDGDMTFINGKLAQ